MRALLLVLALASAADANPRRVVVLDFDGPRELADTGRSSVMALLGDQYDVIATKRWQKARAHAGGKGPQQWRKASKVAGVDAVIEGWVQDEGRHHVMTLSIKDASTGNEVDSISVKLGDHGVAEEASRQLAAQIDDVFGFIDGDVTTTEPADELPDARTELRSHGRHLIDRGDDDGDGGSDADEPAPRAKPVPPARPATATADDEQKATSDLVAVFGADTKEAAIVTNGKTAHPPRPTPRFMVDAGGYLASRGMTWDFDPNAKGGPPTYPSSTISGLSVSAAVFPAPPEKTDGGLQGIGFTARIAHSIGSTLTAMDDTGFGDYVIDHTEWEAGVHYRWPIQLVTIDGELDYGNVTHTIEDLPQSIAIPDTAYSYVGAGAHVDLAVTDRATVGFGARYLYVLGTGDISSEDWYGAGTAWGAALDGSFVIPLPGSLFLRGALEYRRFHVEFEGSGALAQKWGVWDVDDTSIGGSAHIGVAF